MPNRGVFQWLSQFSAYLGHWVYLGHSCNRVEMIDSVLTIRVTGDSKLSGQSLLQEYTLYPTKCLSTINLLHSEETEAKIESVISLRCRLRNLKLSINS